MGLLERLFRHDEDDEHGKCTPQRPRQRIIRKRRDKATQKPRRKAKAKKTEAASVPSAESKGTSTPGNATQKIPSGIARITRMTTATRSITGKTTQSVIESKRMARSAG